MVTKFEKNWSFSVCPPPSKVVILDRPLWNYSLNVTGKWLGIQFFPLHRDDIINFTTFIRGSSVRFWISFGFNQKHFKAWILTKFSLYSTSEPRARMQSFKYFFFFLSFFHLRIGMLGQKGPRFAAFVKKGHLLFHALLAFIRWKILAQAANHSYDLR